MFEDMPDDPLPRAFAEDSLLFFAQKRWTWKNAFKVGGDPVGKCVGNHAPGGLKSCNQLGGLKRELLLFVLWVPVRDGGKIGTPFAHPHLEPPDTAGNNMLRNHPY